MAFLSFLSGAVTSIAPREALHTACAARVGAFTQSKDLYFQLINVAHHCRQRRDDQSPFKRWQSPGSRMLQAIITAGANTCLELPGGEQSTVQHCTYYVCWLVFLVTVCAAVHVQLSFLPMGHCPQSSLWCPQSHRTGMVLGAIRHPTTLSCICDSVVHHSQMPALRLLFYIVWEGRTRKTRTCLVQRHFSWILPIYGWNNGVGTHGYGTLTFHLWQKV